MPSQASTTIQLRASPDDRALIDAAAAARGVTRTEFMLAASKAAATDQLLDRTRVELTAEAFGAVLDGLGHGTLGDADRMGKLLAAATPWKGEGVA